MVLPVFENSIFPALMQLNKNNRALDIASERVSTGLRVNSADDDVATYIRGITLNNTISQLDSRQGAAKTAYVPLDSAIQTMENYLDTLSDIRQNLTDTLASGDYTSGSSIHTQLATSLTGISQGSSVDGRDLLATAGANADITFYVNGGAGDIAVTGQDISAGNVTGLNLAAGGTLGTFVAFATQADVITEIAKVDADVSVIQAKLGTLVAARAAIQAIQNSDESSQLKTEEVRNTLLAADMEKESATLTALQTQVDVGRTVIGLLSGAQRNVLAIFG